MKHNEIIEAAVQHASGLIDKSKKSLDMAAFIDGARHMASVIYNRMSEEDELTVAGINIFYEIEEYLFIE